MNTLLRFLPILGCALLLTFTACGTDNDDDGGSGNNGDNNAASNNGGGTNNGGTNNGGTNNGDNNGGTNNGGTALSCDNLGDCGGDVTGTWAFDVVCFSETGPQTDPDNEECPEFTTQFTNIDFNGSTITFNADGTYSSTITNTIDVEFVYPASCLPDGADLDTLCATIEEQFTQDEQVATCSPQDGGCVCNSAFTSDDQEGGTWSVEGSTLTTTTDVEGDEPESLTFCVQGDTVSVTDDNPEEGIPFTGFLLQRQ